MNAAARVIHQSNMFTGHWFALRLSQQQSILISLLVALLLTSVAIAYVTNAARLALSELESQERHTHELRLEWGQLLLEQASLMTPARVEQVAVQKLKMHLPTATQQSVLVIH